MMRWTRLVIATCALAVVSTACLLRPRFQELAELSPGEGPIVVRIVDASTGTPLADTRVTIGDGADRLQLKTDANGVVSIPREARLASSNALVIVAKPTTVDRFRFEAAPAAQVTPEPEPATEPAPEPTPEPQADPVQPPLTPDGGVGPGQPPGVGAAPPTRGGDMMDTATDPADAGTPASSTSAQ